ncbi:MAG: TetR/AcrR family transcriptional regulator [Acholeplasmataceae bacterium]|nr:TetR/AcrR family transcriptional regulator [Acholeplasmataceae bacterium]
MSSQEIKRKLIENTKILIQKHATVTIKDIADASYVNIAAVNYHFGSKEKLMKIVIEEVLGELKRFVTEQVINVHDGKTTEEKLEKMMNYIYNFSLENVGLLNYLFLSSEIQSESSSMLIDNFFADNEFTQLVYKSLAEAMNIHNQKELFAKYILLFSSFCIPLFIQISQMKLHGSMKIEMFMDPEFRQYYIKSIMKMA